MSGNDQPEMVIPSVPTGPAPGYTGPVSFTATPWSYRDVTREKALEQAVLLVGTFEVPAEMGEVDVTEMTLKIADEFVAWLIRAQGAAANYGPSSE